LAKEHGMSDVNVKKAGKGKMGSLSLYSSVNLRLFQSKKFKICKNYVSQGKSEMKYSRTKM
jgi:hypothetical protein